MEMLENKKYLLVLLMYNSALDKYMILKLYKKWEMQDNIYPKNLYQDVF